MRYETPASPAELGERDGLASSLRLPDADPWAGVVILHADGVRRRTHGERPFPAGFRLADTWGAGL